MSERLLIKNFSNRVFKTSSLNEPSEIRDRGIDSTDGGYYKFYKNGELRSYFFLKDTSSISAYTLEFDSLGGLMSVEGDPLIYKRAELVKDSLTITFYFSTLINEYKSVRITSLDSSSDSVNLFIDTLFSNVMSAKYVFRNLQIKQDVFKYLDCVYKIKCTGEERIIRDSIWLQYEPKAL